ncbi:MAG: SCO6880 family protein [Actinomycetota bacterium]
MSAATRMPPLPPPLEGQRFETVPTAGGQAGVVHDPAQGAYAATLRVGGRQFALVDPAEQEVLLSLWGDALAAFCREGSPVAEVRWSEWVAPAGMEEQHAYLREHATAEPAGAAQASYREVLGSVAPVATRHEVLVTVVVSARRGRSSARRREREGVTPAVAVLLEEVRQLRRRLEAAGLFVWGPLDVRELWRAVRVRLDPSIMSALEGTGCSLAERAGLSSVTDRGPLRARTEWSQVSVDGAVHRSWWFRDWPRTDVGPAWMANLLLFCGCVRTVSVCLQPVPLRVSQRAILRQAAKLESDVSQRQRSGFRVGAYHRRAAQAVEEREEELVSGFSELEYVGLVTATASSVSELDTAGADLVEVAAGCHVELQPLQGRHADGLAAALPLARGLAHRLVTA